MQPRHGILLSIAATVFFCVAAQTVGTFTLKFNKVSVPGAQATGIFGVNNEGAIVGYYVAQDGKDHGLLLRGEKVENIDHPDAINGTYCSNLNSGGNIVGYYYDSADVVHGFVHRDNTFIGVGPGGAPSIAAGINDLGEIVGGYKSNGIAHGFKWNGKIYKTLDVPGAVQTFAADINNSGQITFDWIDTDGNYQGAVLSGGKYTILKVPGAVQSVPNDIDATGDIVFSWVDSNSQYHGAILTGNTFHTFDDPNANGGTYGSGLNDNGTIVGQYVLNNTTESFKATY
jgi:hypothetical protein